MTIASAITALSPNLWLQLNETTGSTAANSGSLSTVGTYSGTLGRGVDGPEVNTLATRLYSGGQVLTGGMDVTTLGNMTIMFWAATDASGPLNTANPLVSLGDAANRMSRGWVVWEQHASVGSPNWRAQWNPTNGSFTGVIGQPLLFWHHYAFSFQTGTSGIKSYVDGALATSSTPGTATPALSTDGILIASVEPFVIAHVAFWYSALTQVQIQTVSSQAGSWPYSPPINTPGGDGGGGGGTTTDDLAAQIAAVQADVDTLLANWTAYNSTTLPSLQDVLNGISAQVASVKTDTGNIVNSLFPQLADVLNDVGAAITDVANRVTGTLQDGADLVQRTVGELLSQRDESSLTSSSPLGSPTCSPINLDIAGSRVYGIRLEITAYPEEWKFRTPDLAWSLKDLAVIRVYHESQLVGRQGVHTISHTWSPIPFPPYPWIGPLMPLQSAGTIITVDWAAGVCGELFLLEGHS